MEEFELLRNVGAKVESQLVLSEFWKLVDQVQLLLNQLDEQLHVLQCHKIASELLDDVPESESEKYYFFKFLKFLKLIKRKWKKFN